MESPEDLRSRWEAETPEGGSRRDAQLRVLRESCRKGGKGRPQQLDLRGIRLVGEDLSELDLSRYDLTGADLSGAVLRQANLSWTQLQGANLNKADLDGAELLAADLSGADLSECRAVRAGFGAANLSEAAIINAQLEGAAFGEAKLGGADLSASNLEKAALRRADLTKANFTRANLRNADLKECNVHGTRFDLADLREARLLGIQDFMSAGWIGADIRDVDLRGAYMIRRFIMDENYLFEFRTRSRYHRMLYWLWWATSDCGRSMLRWGLWVLGVAAVFALFYNVVAIDYGDYPTSISPLYYSVVTLTTLGYGDAVPMSPVAQVLAAFEAVLGYVGLGGFLSILANKFARRAE